MAKFNKGTSEKSRKTTNHGWGVAFEISKEMELYMAVSSYKWKNKFYETLEEQDKRIFKLAKEVYKTNPHFLAGLTKYMRQEIGMRTGSLMLSSTFINEWGKWKLAHNVIKESIERADEITEFVWAIAYLKWLSTDNIKKVFNKTVSKWLSKAFDKFDLYQISKYYRRDKKKIKLKDVLRLAYIKWDDTIVSKKDSKDKITQEEMIQMVNKDSLPTVNTWESNLTKIWQKKDITVKEKEKEKAKNWLDMLKEKKLGVFATLRNLRNMLENENFNEETFDLFKNFLTNENAIKNSKLFPFRFFSAYKVLQNSSISNPYVSMTLDVLEEAIDIASVNVPQFKWVSMLSVDCSGSMFDSWYDEGIYKDGVSKSVDPFDIASLFALMLHKHSNDKTIFTWFATDFDYLSIPKRWNIIEKIKYVSDQAEKKNLWYSTNWYLAIKALNTDKVYVDRIFLFTDEEMYGWDINKELSKYRKNINKNVKVYVFNVCGYNTSQFDENDKMTLRVWGFSEKNFEVINMIENSWELIKMIEKIWKEMEN